MTQPDNFSHDEVFGHLARDAFTASEAAEYLGISVSAFRRHVADGRLKACAKNGRGKLFATSDLKAYKRTLQEARSSAPKWVA